MLAASLTASAAPPRTMRLDYYHTGNAAAERLSSDRIVLDPKDMFVDSSKPASPGPLLEIQKTGDPADKVDFLIVGDGYTAAERPKFEKDARRLTEILFAYSPFKERRSDFNVWGLSPASD